MYKNDLWKTNLADALRVGTKWGKAPLTRRKPGWRASGPTTTPPLMRGGGLKSINPNGWRRLEKRLQGERPHLLSCVPGGCPTANQGGVVMYGENFHQLLAALDGGGSDD